MRTFQFQAYKSANNNSRQLPLEVIEALRIITCRAIKAKQMANMLPDGLGRYQGCILAAKDLVSVFDR